MQHIYFAPETQNITQETDGSCTVLPLPQVASCTQKLKAHLDFLSESFPGLWKKLAEAYTLRSPDLPEWCYLPEEKEYEVISSFLEDNNLSSFSSEDLIFKLSTYANWRLTQGVYRFDPILYEAVIKTPVIGVIPKEVLHHIPEWCIFVETPGLSFSGNKMTGFFAHISYEGRNSKSVLHLQIEFALNFIYTSFPIGDLSLADAVRQAMETVEEHDDKNNHFPHDSFEEEVKLTTVELEPILSLLIFLCSQNGEIGDDSRRPSFPKAKKTKKGLKVFPPDRPTTWCVLAVP